MSTPTRPAMRYHGGKWRLAPWIIQHFPPHRTYVEPFGGAASVLLRKPRSYAEVYNDLDGEIVNVFRVLRNPAQARELVRLVSLTPYSREEFELSYIADDDPIEQARRTIFRSFAGHGSGLVQRTGFRYTSQRAGSIPAHDWSSWPPALESIIERFRGVVVENRPAVGVIGRHDAADTLHYIDPPYPWSTRSERYACNAYTHEMTDDDHRQLAAVLHAIDGMAIISGYACDLYDVELYPDWHRVERQTHADGAQKRTEVLWMNFGEDTGLPLFDM